MTTAVTEVPRLPPRPRDAHKGTFGRVLVVAGSAGMSGAAVLCGSAALRAGAGLVEVATPAEVQPVVAAGHPCYTTTGLGADPLAALAKSLAAATAFAVGPGLGPADRTADFVKQFLVAAVLPGVVDADGLNALATQSGWPTRRAPTVLTPHPGEFARLVGRPVAEVQANRETLASEYAAKRNVVVVLKGAGTVVTDGTRLYRNGTGNPGMATGGTGDVLAGVVAALLGQGLSAFDAAVLGVHVHGLAGDFGAADLGEVSLTALDLLAYLPRAFVHAART